jgi:hypothetical protein
MASRNSSSRYSDSDQRYSDEFAGKEDFDENQSSIRSEGNLRSIQNEEEVEEDMIAYKQNNGKLNQHSVSVSPRSLASSLSHSVYPQNSTLSYSVTDEQFEDMNIPSSNNKVPTKFPPIQGAEKPHHNHQVKPQVHASSSTPHHQNTELIIPETGIVVGTSKRHQQPEHRLSSKEGDPDVMSFEEWTKQELFVAKQQPSDLH